MESFLSTEGSSSADAISKAARICDCPIDEIAYQLVGPQSSTVRIIASSLDIGGNLPHVESISRTEPDWKSAVQRDAWEFSVRSRNPEAPPQEIAELIDRPPTEPLPPEPPRTITGDISASDGCIRHFGDLTVRGNICERADVSARGRIIVFGNIQHHASVVATKKLIVIGGAMGAIASRTDTVQCGFGQDCTVAAKSITVLGDAMHCRLVSESEIDVASVFGGGKAYAEQSVSALTFGMPDSAFVTTIHVGGNLRGYQLVKTAMGRFATANSEWSRNFYAENLQRLLGSYDSTRRSGTIVAHRGFLPPIRLQLGRKRISLKESIGAGTFSLDGQSGRVTATTNE